MKISLKIIKIFLVVFATFVYCGETKSVGKKYNQSIDELIFVHSICRHGDRNIYPSFPKIPWTSEKYWPGGYTQLTNIGKQQHYELGEYFRKRYATLLGNGEYTPNKVYIYSTDEDRVLMSAESALAGLFPPQGNQLWNSHLDWQPIPVHTKPTNHDYILNKRCDRFDYLMNEYKNSTEYKLLFEENHSLIKYLEEKCGEKLNTLPMLSYLYDDLFIKLLKGFRIPWADSVMAPGSTLERLKNIFFEVYTRTDDMKKLRSGFLLEEILERSMSKSQSSLSPDRSLWMYFGHEKTIAWMLNSLGLFDHHQPPYASCLLFELYKSDEGNYMQIFYKNSIETNIPPLKVPNCGAKCSLSTWFELYKNILPTQTVDKECELRDGEALPSDGDSDN